MIISKDSRLKLQKFKTEYLGCEDIWDKDLLSKGEYEYSDEIKALPENEQQKIFDKYYQENKPYKYTCKIELIYDILLFRVFEKNFKGSIKKLGDMALNTANVIAMVGAPPLWLAGWATVALTKKLTSAIDTKKETLANLLVKKKIDLSKMISITSFDCELIEISRTKKSFFGNDTYDDIKIILHGKVNKFGEEKEEILITELWGKPSEIIEDLSKNGFDPNIVKEIDR